MTKKSTTSRVSNKALMERMDALMGMVELVSNQANEAIEVSKAALIKAESMQSEADRLAAIEAELDKEAREAHEKQQRNRANRELLERLQTPRDPNVIRGDGDIKCITKAHIGLDDFTLSDIGETVMLTKEHARKLQDAGKVSIVI